MHNDRSQRIASLQEELRIIRIRQQELRDLIAKRKADEEKEKEN